MTPIPSLKRKKSLLSQQKKIKGMVKEINWECYGKLGCIPGGDKEKRYFNFVEY